MDRFLGLLMHAHEYLGTVTKDNGNHFALWCT